jgi:outer membrane protein
MRRLFLIAGLFPALAGAQIVDGGAPRPITLDEAIRLAQQNSPSTISARNTVNANEATVRTRLSAFLPTISASAGASRQGGRTFFQGELVPYRGDPWSYNRGISASLNLFDGGDRIYQLQAAKANVTSAEANERAQRYSVALSVAQQYYAALAARENRAAAEAALREAEQNLRTAVSRIAAGVATRSDSLRAVIQVGNQRLALLTAENDLANANAALTRLVGSPYLVTPVEADTGQVEPIRVDSAALAAMLDQAPAVLAAQAAVTAARASLRASRTAYFPTLSMSYSMSGSNTSPKFDWGSGPFSQSNSMRFSISIPIFQGLGREESVLRASIAEMNALAQLRDAKLLAQQQLVQYLGQLRLAQARLEIQQASLAAAMEDLRVQQQRYELGTSTQLELLTTQTQLNNARFQLVNARYQVRIARAQLEALLGRELR